MNIKRLIRIFLLACLSFVFIFPSFSTIAEEEEIKYRAVKPEDYDYVNNWDDSYLLENSLIEEENGKLIIDEGK